jgi:hypothetical protein
MAALLVVAMVAIIVTGGLVASNMGFKLNYPLLDSTDPLSQSGTQSIGLPYNRQVGIDNASDLFRDIGLTIATCGATACPCLDNIQRFDTASDSNAPYACGLPDFGLNPGEGLLVKTKSGVSGDYIVVGSHNPALSINLPAPGGGSQSGTSRYTHPYHAVSANASELLTELGGCNFVASIQRFDTATDSNAPYACGFPDIPLAAGQSYLVVTKSSTAPGGIDFVPAHY